MSEAQRQYLEAEISVQPQIPFEQTISATAHQIQYAGLWVRALAFLIDFGLMFAGFLAVAFAVGVNIGIILLSKGYSSSSALDWLSRGLGPVAAAVIFFYWIYFPSRTWQATPGKRLCAIHIVRVDGGRVRGWLALGRMLAYFLSAIPLGLGFLVIA